MFHATCCYNPISYSPLNLKRHYFSPQPASCLPGSLDLWNPTAISKPVSREEHKTEKEMCKGGVRDIRKENVLLDTRFIRP
jgi:hypothetical protein